MSAARARARRYTILIAYTKVNISNLFPFLIHCDCDAHTECVYDDDQLDFLCGIQTKYAWHKTKIEAETKKRCARITMIMNKFLCDVRALHTLWLPLSIFRLESTPKITIFSFFLGSNAECGAVELWLRVSCVRIHLSAVWPRVCSLCSSREPIAIN